MQAQAPAPQLIQAQREIGTAERVVGLFGGVFGKLFDGAIAIAPSLHRGFTSNGRTASVTVFDLDTLKVVATIEGTGEKPDAIESDSW